MSLDSREAKQLPGMEHHSWTSYRLPGHDVGEFDMKLLIWGGHQMDIPMGPPVPTPLSRLPRKPVVDIDITYCDDAGEPIL